MWQGAVISRLVRHFCGRVALIFSFLLLLCGGKLEDDTLLDIARSLHAELWGIFKGSTPNARHELYRQKGKARANLKYQVRQISATEMREGGVGETFHF